MDRFCSPRSKARRSGAFLPAGGVPVALVKPEAAQNAVRVNWPVLLPDGRRFLYLERRTDGSGHLMIAAPGVAAREVRPLQSKAEYVAPGYLVFAAEGALLAQRFDLSTGAISGDPFSVAERVSYFLATTFAGFSTSLDGTIAYTARDDEQRLVMVRSRGAEPRNDRRGGRLSIARACRATVAGWRSIAPRAGRSTSGNWTSTGATRRASPSARAARARRCGIPTAGSLFFRADLGGPPRVYRKDLVTGREALVLPGSGTMQEPEDVSPDGRTLLFTQRAAGGFDIWQLPTDGSRAPSVVVATPFDEESVRFSPDGMRFRSTRTCPDATRCMWRRSRRPVSSRASRLAGGVFARWSRDGRELFYLGDRRPADGERRFGGPVGCASALRSLCSATDPTLVGLRRRL